MNTTTCSGWLRNVWLTLLDWMSGRYFSWTKMTMQHAFAAELLDQRNLAFQSGVDSTRPEVAALRKQAEHARAQLMQLRVENSDPASLGRIGWQVSAWIPQEVLDTITSERKAQHLKRDIADGLVDQALRGIFRVNSKGAVAALVFEPMSLDSDKRVVSVWFEGDPERPGYIAPEGQMEKLARLYNEEDFRRVFPAHKKISI